MSKRLNYGNGHKIKKTAWYDEFSKKYVPSEKLTEKTKARIGLMLDRECRERSRANKHELALFSELSKVYGKNIVHQKGIMVGSWKFYIVDIYHGLANVAIEVDGSNHKNNQYYDSLRNQLLFECRGVTTVRVSIEAVLYNLDHVVKSISMLIDRAINGQHLEDTYTLSFHK